MILPGPRGVEVIICPSLAASEEVLRGFWERWFSRPWHPFTYTKTVPVGYVILDGKVLVCPERVEWLKAAIARYNENAGGGG